MIENSHSKSWFDKRAAIERLRHYLSIGNSKVRIATGYFSVSGWNLIRQAIGDKQVDLIVGIHEPDRKDVQQVKQVIIQNLLHDLSTGRTENRRQVVEELIQKIKSGKLKVVDGRSYRHHAKLYIIDRQIAILGSANLSVSGLRNQVEAGIDISDSSEIDYLIKRFNYYFDLAQSLTQELLDTLEFSRKSFNRLTALVHNSDCKVLLLTGSPYSKSINNLNDQLLLLPYTSEGNKRWQINSIQEYLNLSVVCQLTTPYVAKKYGQKEDNNLFIEFGSDKKYIPSVNLYKICVPLFLENDVIHLLKSDILITTDSIVSSDCIKREVQTCWASSPAAISHALRKAIDTPTGKNSYNVNFLRSQEDRKTKILPLLEKICSIKYQDDSKLLAIVEIVKKSYLKNEKIIIFVERKVTIIYLQNALNELVPKIKVFSTINNKEDKYVHKSDRCIEKAIKEFAPIANKQTKASIDTYDLFLSTDAYGVGINLQDAPVVINYDLAWTPIDPIQRAGRILRPWILPRTLKLYTFVPITDNDSVEKLGIIRRWVNLSDRHAESKTIIDLPVLPLQEEESIDNLSDLASGITIESGKLNIDLFASEPVSTDLSQHASVLKQSFFRTLASRQNS